MKFALSVLVGSILLISCTTITKYEPTDENRALIVGRITLNAEDFNRAGNSSVNGIHRRNIILTFVNILTKEETEVRTVGDSGIFYVPVSRSGGYRLIKVFYKKTSGDGSWASIWTNPRLSTLYIDTDHSEVINLGNLIWQADKTYNDYEVILESGFEDVRSVFSEVFPESEWLGLPWKSHG